MIARRRAIGERWFRWRLILTFGGLLTLLVALLVASIVAIVELNRSSTEKYVENAIPLSGAVQDLMLHLVEQQTGMRGYLITGDPASLEPYESGRDAARADLAEIRAHLADEPALASLVARAEPQIERLGTYFASQIALAGTGPAGRAEAQRRLPTGESLFGEFRATADAMQEEADALVAEAQESQDRRSDQLIALLAVLGGLAIPLAIVLVAGTQRRSGRYVVELAEARESIEQALASERHANDEVAALVRRFQESLLPTVRIMDPAVRVQTFYRPGDKRLHLGGDFYDCVELRDGTLAVLVGDVVGHGPDAAALGASLRAAWRGLALSETDVDEVLRCMQAVLERERASEESFATACYGLVDPARTVVSYTLAGHPAPFLVGTGEARLLDGETGLPLGVDQRAHWGVTTAELPSGSTLVLYTDGLLEGRARPGSSERFGAARLERALVQEHGLGVAELTLEHLVETVMRAGGEPPADDIAILALSFEGELDSR